MDQQTNLQSVGMVCFSLSGSGSLIRFQRNPAVCGSRDEGPFTCEFDVIQTTVSITMNQFQGVPLHVKTVDSSQMLLVPPSFRSSFASPLVIA